MFLTFLIFFGFTTVLSETRTDWSKCSKPCDEGEQRNSDGNVRSCNFEPCSIYEEGPNLLQGKDETYLNLVILCN